MKLITSHCCRLQFAAIHVRPPPLCAAQDLLATMIYVCELLTGEPEGGSAMIPAATFLRLYGYLAELDCSGEQPRAVCAREDTAEVFQPCRPASGTGETSTGTSRSSSYRVPCADVDQEEREEEVAAASLAE